MNKFQRLKAVLGKKCQSNELMSKHTSVGLGGPAKLFLKVTKEKELIRALSLAKKFSVPLLILGGGSNLLFADKGFRGLVICNRLKGMMIDKGLVRLKSGTNLQEFIEFLVKRGFSGMEKMFGIPGTLGGAIYGNAGAYGQTIGDNLKRVKVLDDLKVKWLTKKECKFKYRESIFKKTDLIILEVEFEFKKGNPKKLKKQVAEILKTRLLKYPQDMKCPGSFFKNVLVKDLSSQVLAKIPKEKIVYAKIPAGYFLEMVGAKGKRKGNIQIADYHANLFFNLGKGRATDFYSLAKDCQNRVKKEFGIKLEPEVQLIGFNHKL